MVEFLSLSERQQHIYGIIKNNGPLSGEDIARRLKLSRGALRSDLAVLTVSGLVEARPRVGYYVSGQIDNIEDLQGVPLVDEIKSMPIVIREEVSVYDGIVTMFLEDVGTLIVVDQKGFLSGVVSRKDFLKAAIGCNDLQKIPVAIIMTRMPNIITVDPEVPVTIAVNKIIDYQVDCLPVVVEKESGMEVIGRVTKTNLTYLLKGKLQLF